MSYRTYINETQVFGNNEYYPEWIEFITSQGIKVDNEGHYKGVITDFMGMLQTVETITMRLEQKRNNLENQNVKSHSIFDFSNIPESIIPQPKLEYNMSLFDALSETIKTGYAFMPYQLYMACKDKLEPDKPFSTPNHFSCYKLKDGETIPISAN